jgi:hypothetical protein
MTPHNDESEIAEAMVGWACSLGRRRVQNFGGKPLGRPRRRWNNIKMHIREVDCDSGAVDGWN